MTRGKDLRHGSELIGVKPDAEYRRSFADRIGPEGADILRAINWSIVPTAGGAFIGVGWLLKTRGLPPSPGLSVAYIALYALIGAMIVGGCALLFIFGISRGAGAGFGSFIHPQGEYKRDYSLEDSLVAKGDVAGAIESYAAIAAAEPENLDVRLRAAELHRKRSAFEEASALYRDVQSKAQRPEDDIQASMRLIDLYMVWPGYEGRSMRELRRLIYRYPGSDVERRSKEALANLKRERFSAEA